MDTKKNLNPELKAIYDRVMSTTSTPKSSAAPVNASITKDTPKTPPAASRPAASPSPVSVPTAPAQQLNQEPYLASSSPRPVVKDPGTFVYSSHGKKNTVTPKNDEKKQEKAELSTQQQQVKSADVSKKGSSLLPILMITIGLFLIIYTVFWAIYFNII